jgi:hypothetical protein
LPHQRQRDASGGHAFQQKTTAEVCLGEDEIGIPGLPVKRLDSY